MHAVLLVGVPRGGTTWVGQVLGHTRSARYVHEPDGTHDPFAFRAKLGMLSHPMLDPGDEAPDFEALWAGAFAGGALAGTIRDRVAWKAFKPIDAATKMRARNDGHIAPRLRLALAAAMPRRAVPGLDHTIVKTVNAAFCAEWIASRFSPTVGVITRHPLNVVASWREFAWSPPRGPMYKAIRARARERWNVELPQVDAPPIARATAMAGALAYGLADARSRHPDWVDISHDDLCVDTAALFPAVAERLHLEWTDEAAEFLAGTDKAGKGYATKRVTAEQPQRWRDRLDADDIGAATAVLARFHGAWWLDSLPNTH